MASKQDMIYIYEAPVRICHWVSALSITVLAVTGYLIGSPLPSVPGEASEHFVMGYIRFAHFAAGHVLAAAMVLRIYWAFVGNRVSRQLFVVPVWRASFWKGLWTEVRWYLFLEKEPLVHLGHNPLASLAMFLMFVLGALFMIVTGFALYGEGTGEGSWAHAGFTTWVIPLFGQSQDVHTWHHLGMWYVVVFVMIHVYMAIREDIMGRSHLVSSMLNGWRYYKDDSA
jgi:Ni/Fe-hydrogenase 1 B-type cytochrome subunit